MLNDIIANNNSIIIYNDGQIIKINNLKEMLQTLLTGSYFSPSFAPTPITINDMKTKGVWIDINFDTKQNYKEYEFTRLSFNIKPKHNWITFYPFNDNAYSRKPITLNLSTPTTSLFKYITTSKETK